MTPTYEITTQSDEVLYSPQLNDLKELIINFFRSRNYNLPKFIEIKENIRKRSE